MELPEYSDQDLLSLVRKDDVEFLKILFRLYYDRLCMYALTFVKIPDIAEEVVQETFVRLWENREEIRINHSIRAYIYRSVHNNCINYLKKCEVLRRHSKEVADEIIYHNEIALRNFDNEILDKLVAEETEKKLERALEELPPQARKIFIMSRFDQKSYDEIASALKISVNTVKTQMRRTLARLKELFNSE
jgi:RNA polymerase sigma-70 factor, ECF subfamily